MRFAICGFYTHDERHGKKSTASSLRRLLLASPSSPPSGRSLERPRRCPSFDRARSCARPDYLRRERRRDEDIPFDEEHDRPGDGYGDAPADAPIDDALAALVGELPPKERASVLLKDVLEYPIEQVADIADSTVGGVKAALHRARQTARDEGGTGCVGDG